MLCDWFSRLRTGDCRQLTVSGLLRYFSAFVVLDFGRSLLHQDMQLFARCGASRTVVLRVPQGGTFADVHSALLRKEPSLAVCSDLVRNSRIVARFQHEVVTFCWKPYARSMC